MDNDFQNQVNEDLSGNSQEPATKGDIRNLALRVELRFTKLESNIDQRFAAVDQRFTKLESNIDQRFATVDQRFTAFDLSIKEYVYKLGWKFFGGTIGSVGVMFTVFAMFISAQLK